MQPGISDVYDPEQFHDKQEEGICLANVLRRSAEMFRAMDLTLPLEDRIATVFGEVEDCLTHEHQVYLWLKYMEQCGHHASENDFFRG